MWMAAGRPWFENFANGTESFIVARLAKSKQDGILSEGGLIGNEVIIPTDKEALSYQYEVYYNNIPIQQYRTYKSTPAIQGILFSTLDRCLGLPARTNVKLFRLIAAGFSASILAIFLLWVLDIFGLFPTLMSLLMIMLSPWLTVSGGHLHWIFGMIFLPFLIPLLLLHREYKGGKFYLPLWIIGIAFGVLLKCLFNGYELITTALVEVTIPVFFYALWQRWKPRLFIKRFIAASCAGILGVLVSAAILSVQIAHSEGSMQNGMEHLQKRLLARTYPAFFQKELPPSEKKIGYEPTATVLKKNIACRAFSISTRQKDYNLSFGSLLLILAVTTVIIFTDRKNRLLLALTLTTWISILAPFSWFVIFKSHSALHLHLNPVAWYMPTLLLLFVNVTAPIECWRRK
jgi:hypothetical protein